MSVSDAFAEAIPVVPVEVLPPDAVAHDDVVGSSPAHAPGMVRSTPKAPKKPCGTCRHLNFVASHKCASCGSAFEIKGGIKKWRRNLGPSFEAATAPRTIEEGPGDASKTAKPAPLSTEDAGAAAPWDRQVLARKLCDLVKMTVSPVVLDSHRNKAGTLPLPPVTEFVLLVQCLRAHDELNLAFETVELLLGKYAADHGFEALRTSWHPALLPQAVTSVKYVAQIARIVTNGATA